MKMCFKNKRIYKRNLNYAAEYCFSLPDKEKNFLDGHFQIMKLKVRSVFHSKFKRIAKFNLKNKLAFNKRISNCIILKLTIIILVCLIKFLLLHIISYIYAQYVCRFDNYR
jgi:hypothetical protein